MMDDGDSVTDVQGPRLERLPRSVSTGSSETMAGVTAAVNLELGVSTPTTWAASP